MSPKTYTYTWTETRLETIQDQFRYLLTYGGINEGDIDKIVHGVSEKAIQAVGIYGCDRSGLRVIEVELRVDWALSAELTLTVPTITSGLSGWDGKQAPEVKVAGRRFATAAKELGLSKSYWVSFVQNVHSNSALHAEWRQKLGVGGTTPAWKSPPGERNERFLDLEEASIYIRRAGG
ncbi:MAG: hypothetical protein JO281_23055 [Pseudonocardiales bacterium]|nr:hypothetical protein [Pseudonocardiales bacterium]MBV9164354.1 hypothetical protein [Pseudonocardiales bacterium]